MGKVGFPSLLSRFESGRGLRPTFYLGRTRGVAGARNALVRLEGNYGVHPDRLAGRDQAGDDRCDEKDE